MNSTDWEKKLLAEVPFAVERSVAVIENVQDLLARKKTGRRPSRYKWAAVAIVICLIGGSLFAVRQPSKSADPAATASPYKAAIQTHPNSNYKPAQPSFLQTPDYDPGAFDFFFPEYVEVGDKVGSMTVAAKETGFKGADSIRTQFKGDIELSGEFTYATTHAANNAGQIVLKLDEASAVKLPWPTKTSPIFSNVILDVRAGDLARFGGFASRGKVTVRISGYDSYWPFQVMGPIGDHVKADEIVSISEDPNPLPDLNEEMGKTLTPFPALKASEDASSVYAWVRQLQEHFKQFYQVSQKLQYRELSSHAKSQMRAWLTTAFTSSKADWFVQRLFFPWLDGYLILDSMEDYSRFYPPTDAVSFGEPRIVKGRDSTYTLTVNLYGSGARDYEFMCRLSVGSDGNFRIADYSYKPAHFYSDHHPSMKENGDFPIPESIKDQWDEAKRKPGQTTAIKDGSNWYIYPQKGYYIEHVETGGREGNIVLMQIPKSAGPYKLENYNVDSFTVTLKD